HRSFLPRPSRSAHRRSRWGRLNLIDLSTRRLPRPPASWPTYPLILPTSRPSRDRHLASISVSHIAQQPLSWSPLVSQSGALSACKRQTVAGEPTGVVAESQVQVAQIAFDVVEAVRIDHAERGAGKIVVQSFLGLLRVEPALPEQKPQEFETIATLPGPIRGSLGREQGESTWDPLNASELAPNSANGLFPSLIAWAESQPAGNVATVSRIPCVWYPCSRWGRELA